MMHELPPPASQPHLSPHLSCSPASLASLQLLLLPASGPRHLLSPQVCAEPGLLSLSGRRSSVTSCRRSSLNTIAEAFTSKCPSAFTVLPDINPLIGFIPPAVSSSSGTSLATCTEIPSAHSSVRLASGSPQIHLKHRRPLVCGFPQAQEADTVRRLHRGEPWRGCSRALKPGLLAWGLSSGWGMHFPSSLTCQALSSMLTDTDPVSPTSILRRTVPIPVVRGKVETERWSDWTMSQTLEMAGLGVEPW